MKQRILALPSLALLAASLSMAQTPNKVGVIQIQSALVSTKDGQHAVAELQSRMAPKQREMENKRNELQQLQDKLTKGGNAMAQAAKDELTSTIAEKTKVYNRDMEDAQAELQAEQRKLLEELSGKMQAVIDKYAVANGYSVILDVSNQNTNVLYVATGADITKDVIELYDKMNPAAPTTAKPGAPVTRPTSTPTAPARKQP